jgi:hypothetical protein
LKITIHVFKVVTYPYIAFDLHPTMASFDSPCTFLNTLVRKKGPQKDMKNGTRETKKGLERDRLTCCRYFKIRFNLLD